jgi:RsiW-degrading membrane proteinase PrsW (M82 family)
MKTAFLVFSLFAVSALPLVAVFLFAKRRQGSDFGFSRFLLAATAGICAVLPVLVVQSLLPLPENRLHLLLFRAFIIAALVEEAGKYLALFLVRRRLGGEGNAVLSGLTVSLGFALFETISYASADPDIAFVRAFTAAPLHAACGVWLGRAVHLPPLPAAGRFVFALLVHGSYDLVLSVSGFPIAVPIILTFAALVLALGSESKSLTISS